MENTTFLKIAVVVLLVLNIGTLAFVWSRRSQHPGPEKREAPHEFLIRSVGFDEAQQARYRSLIEPHRAEMEATRKQILVLQDQYFGFLGQKTADDPVALSLLDSMTNLKKRADMTTFRHFAEVRTLCRPEQVARFDSVIVEAVRSMRPGGKPRPEGRPPH